MPRACACRAHYELFIRALDAPNVREGGVCLVHPTCGPTQDDDIPGDVRYRTYEVLKVSGGRRAGAVGRQARALGSARLVWVRAMGRAGQHAAQRGDASMRCGRQPRGSAASLARA